MNDQLFIFDTTSDPNLIKFTNQNNSTTTKTKTTTTTTTIPEVELLPIQSSSKQQPLHSNSIHPDLIDSAPSARRYWKEPTGITCTICHEPDHSAKNCEHELCLTCGAIDEHITRLCPVSLVCFACGSRGHLSRHCPTSAESRILGKDCIKCGSTNHLSLNCPSIWRCYEEIKIPNRKPKPLVPSCYNCGGNGDHFGDECPFGRHGRFRDEPSAFSIRAYSTDHPRHHSSHSRSSRHHLDHEDRYPPPPSRDPDHRSHKRYANCPPPPSVQSRRPLPLPYEEEEDDDWFSKRNRTQNEIPTGPSRKEIPTGPSRKGPPTGPFKKEIPTGPSKKEIPTGPSRKPNQSQKKSTNDHWEPKNPAHRKKNEQVFGKIEIKSKVTGGREESHLSGKNGRVEEREAGNGTSAQRHRIGGSYKGGYTRR